MNAQTTQYRLARQLDRIGARARKALELTSRKRWDYTPQDLRMTAALLRAGDGRAGVRRPWPNLAARLDNLAQALEGWNQITSIIATL